jgi:DNA-binding transcriptional MocR family regulator
VNRTHPAGADAALRRELGPVAWCALECLLERSDDGRTSVATVRAVATDLGVAKNTAHRAMTALASAGLIEPEQRRGRDGKFEPGRYFLHLDDLLRATPTPTPPRTSRPRRAPTAAPPDQLTFLTTT